MSTKHGSIAKKKRQELEKKEHALLKELEDRAEEINTKMSKVLTQAAIIAGGLLAGYAMYKALFGRREDPVEVTPKEANKSRREKRRKEKAGNKKQNSIVSFIVDKGTSLAIELIKQKLLR